MYASSTIGDFVGTISLTEVYNYLGYEYLYLANSSFLVISIFFALLRLQHIVPNKHSSANISTVGTGSSRSCVAFFNLDTFLINFKSLTKKRSGNQRCKLNLLILAMLASCFAYGGKDYYT